MAKILYTLLIGTLLTACSTNILKGEYAVVEKNDIVKACYYDEYDSAKRAATNAFLENHKMNFSSNNNSICNSYGCVQEDELRTYSSANLNVTLMRRDVKTDCRYFQITLNKKPSKVNKHVWTNQEGQFDISDESDKSFLYINVVNRQEIVSATMNGKVVILNNNEPILIRGQKTLKFVISNPGFEKKEFTIKTPEKAHKIIKNITLVPIKLKVSESSIGYGFKKISSRSCWFFCDRVDTVVNDEPFDFSMVKNEQTIGLNYFLFNDLNLYKSIGFKAESEYLSDENAVEINVKPFIHRGSEFEEAMDKASVIGRVVNGHDRTDILAGSKRGLDVGSSPDYSMHLDIVVRDSTGKIQDSHTRVIKMYTFNMYPEFRRWANTNYRFKFYGIYNKNYTISYKVRMRFDSEYGLYAGNLHTIKRASLWWWDRRTGKAAWDDPNENIPAFYKIMEKYAKKLEKANESY